MKLKLLSTTLALASLVAFLPVTSLAADDTKADPRPGPRSRPNREAVIAQFDQDGDGRLNETERAAAREFRQQNRPGGGFGGPNRENRGQWRDRMARFDADGDGKLSAEERATMETTARAHIRNNPRAMARVDTDGDGEISDAEWEAGRQQLRQRLGEGRLGKRKMGGAKPPKPASN